MIIQKKLCLYGLLLFSTPSLYTMDAQASNQQEQDTSQAPGQNQQDPSARAPQIPQQTFEDAKRDFYNQKRINLEEAQKLQARMQSYWGKTEDAFAKESVAYGFKVLDRGLIQLFEMGRKKLDLLSEDERKVEQIKKIEDRIKQANEKAITLNNDFTTERKNAKIAAKKFFESQKDGQDIQNLILLCSNLPRRFDNPECIKKLNEYAQKMGMDPSNLNENA